MLPTIEPGWKMLSNIPSADKIIPAARLNNNRCNADHVTQPTICEKREGFLILAQPASQALQQKQTTDSQ